MDEKLELILKIALEYFDDAKVYWNDFDVIHYGRSVALRGVYKRSKVDFKTKLITYLYEQPIYHLEVGLRKIIEEYFDYLNKRKMASVK